MSLSYPMVIVQWQTFKIISSKSWKNYTLSTNPPIHIIHQSSKKFLGSTKSIYKTKKGKDEPSLEVFEVVVVQCNLVDNQNQQSLRYYILLRLRNLMLIC